MALRGCINDDRRMRFIVTLCVLLITTHSITSAQQSRTALTRAQVKEAERTLADLGYWTGAIDGVPDATTRAALISFQKWEGRPVTGQLTIDELEAIRTAASPKPREDG